MPTRRTGDKRKNSDGSVLAYSADTGPTEELVRLADMANVLLVEATWLDVPEGAAPIHLSAEQAGAHAARARGERLILTHLRWAVADPQGGLGRASQAFGNEVSLAEEGLRVRV